MSDVQSPKGLTARNIYVGQRVRHPVAGYGEVVRIEGNNRRGHATVQYEDGPINLDDQRPPRGLAWIRDLEDADA